MADGAHGFLMTSVATRADGETIARALLAEKLAACVQLVPIESFYVWKGAQEQAGEILLLVKTRTALFETAIARIKALHPYETPEIAGLPFSAGFAGYFAWMDSVTHEQP
jgi:periplasmic divalent cation tolerance protein